MTFFISNTPTNMPPNASPPIRASSQEMNATQQDTARIYAEWNTWQRNGEHGESRDVAVHRMRDCYEGNMPDSLDLSELNLRSLPSTLPPTLTQLSVSHNDLTRLPDLPASLKTIVADHNRLQYLPRLPSILTTLIVDHNDLIDLPEHWPDSLGLIDIGNNPFTHLPDAITALSRLCNIYVENHSLPAERLQHLREKVRAANDVGPRFFYATIEEGPP